MPGPVLVSVAGGVPTAPSEPYAFRYFILTASTLAPKGGLRGVLNEPTFTGTLNAGSAHLQLTVDHFPTELTFGDVVRVNYPDGEIAGMWRYEKRATKLAAASPQYTLDLSPLVAELTAADFTGNYTADTTQPTAPLGTVTFDVPVTAAAARTQHVTPGVIQSNGVAYGYNYNLATCTAPLSQAMLFGGSGWWWYCDHLGVLSLRNSSPFTHDIQVGTQVTAGDWTDDIISLWNGQPVTGGQPGNSTTQLTAFAQDTNPANPYSVPNLGRRTNSVYSDSSILDQTSLNTVATNLLAFNERVSSLRTVTLLNYRIRRPQPGDAVLLREPADPGQRVSGANPLTVDGPFLIVAVTERGATYTFDVTINASMTVPISAFNPNLETDQAVAKLMQNPATTALSPSGAVGNIGSGVLGGLATGGTAYTSVPGVPVGLFATTGLDLIAQTNNAYVVLTWSAPSPNDVVTRYDVQWRKSTDPDVPASYYHTTASSNGGVKIGSLIQGTGYTFQVRSTNDIGISSAWSAGYALTVAVDVAAPAVPTNLTAYRTARGALVFWNGTASSAAGDLQGYLLRVNINGDGFGFRPVNTNPYLGTSFAYVAPKTDGNGVAIVQGTVLVFQIASVDWTGNQSAWTSASTNVLTDGVIFDDLMAGNITAAGTLQGGSIQTGSSGARVLLDANGMTLYDGSADDHGGGPGVTAILSSWDGSAFFSGVVSASMIQGVAGATGGTGPRMWADFATIAPGVGPLLDINDGTYDRVQVGNLSSSGVSPAQYGIRVNNALGNPIMDAYGLIGTVSQAGSAGGGSPGVSFPVGTTPVQVTATNTAFSVTTRAQWMLVLANTSMSNQSSDTVRTYLNLGVVGQGNSTTQTFTTNFWGPTAPDDLEVGAHMSLFIRLPVGAYTAAIFASASGSGFGSVLAYDIKVLQLGA